MLSVYLFISFVFLLSYQFSSLIVTANPSLNTINLTLNVSTSYPYLSQPIPSNMYGLSIEWWNPQRYTGTSPNLKKSFHNVLKYITPTNVQREGGPTLRIGGSSADRSFYNPSGDKHNIPSDMYDFVHSIVDLDFISLHDTAKLLNLTVIIGINFRRAYNITLPIPEVEAIDRLIGWDHIRVEIGNEPELYSYPPYEKYRPTTWGWVNFTAEYDWLTDQVYQAVPNMPKKNFQGGAFCCPTFQSKMSPWAIDRSKDLWSLSFHHYTWNGCGDYPKNMDALLSDMASLQFFIEPLQKGSDVTMAQLVNQVIDNTRHDPVRVVMGEGNSVGCEGEYNFTDTFGQALWVLDYTLALTSLNISGAYFYLGWERPSDYVASPFVYDNDTTDNITIFPMLSGMWMFSRSVDYAARHLSFDRVDNGDVSLVKSWITKGENGNIHLIIIHKDYNMTTNTTITLSLLLPSNRFVLNGILLRLTAPSIFSKDGVKMGGFTFDGTTDGVAVGTAQNETVVGKRQNYDNVESANVVYSFDIMPASAALLILPYSNELDLTSDYVSLSE